MTTLYVAGRVIRLEDVNGLMLFEMMFALYPAFYREMETYLSWRN